MNIWNRLNFLAAISPEDSPERYYFLKNLNTTDIIWGIRIIFLIIAIILLVVYIKVKMNQTQKDGE